MHCRILLILLLLSACKADAQKSAADSLCVQYPFLQVQQNVLLNDTVGLSRFYRKMLALESGGVKQVNVVHIGDSHIQADLFSGRVRQELQKEYGNAGRGLIFPYKVARTNEPWSYKTTSDTRWQTRRNISADTTLPIGISGITIRTTDTAAVLNLKLSRNPVLDYRFNKVTVLHQKGPQAYDWLVTDEQQRPLSLLGSRSSLPGDYASVLHCDSLVNGICFRTSRTDTTQTHAQLYGLVLENGEPGVLYHSIGVNGAEFRHYNRSEYFAEQLAALRPDLFIISLGTNDAFGSKFSADSFEDEVDAMISRLRQLYPQADILLTTPPDSYRARKYRNPDMKQARSQLIQYAYNNGLASWDFYEVMGGYGSMLKWLQAGLAVNDRVHLSAKGYDVQGLLLFSAIKDGFERFAAARSE